MWDLLKPLARRYAPVIGRYLATAAVGLLAASLNKLNLSLDPQSSAELTAGLGALFVALLGFALNGTKQQTAATDAAVAAHANDASLAEAVRQSALSGQEVATEDPITGQIHLITAKLAPQTLAQQPKAPANG